MVNLAYVVKRKRRKITALVSLIGSIVITSFTIISFLGQKTGSFTIQVKNDDVKLALSTTSDFEEETQFLRANDLGNMNLYCFQDFKDEHDVLDFTSIDNEEVKYPVGSVVYDAEDSSTVKSFNYYKYTFFLKNVGQNSARYEMALNIYSNTADSDTNKKVDSFLRAMVIEDGNYQVFAKRSNDATHYSPDDPDNKSTLEYIDGAPGDEKNRFEGLANEFVNGTTVCKYKRTGFNSGDMKRYTLLFWLEGDDAEATGLAPKDCKLRLGVEFQAYEN